MRGKTLFRNFLFPGRGGGGAGALLAEDGRILDFGPERAFLREWGGRGIPQEDLGGGYLYPGFRDAHGHLFWLGREILDLDLRGTDSPEAVLERVAARARSLPEGAWILGGGWDEAEWKGEGTLGAGDLDRAAPENPVWLIRRDGHAGLANGSALALAGLGRETPDPPGGKILRGAGGTPTGVLVDRAMELVEKVLPPPGREDEEARLLAAQERCLRAGLTAVGEAGVTSLQVEVLAGLARSGKLRLRVYAMGLPEKDAPPGEIPWEPVGGPGDFFQARAWKLFADGSLGSRSAAMFEPLEGGGGSGRGLLLLDEEDVALWGKACLERGFQLCVHAIGDRALDVVLRGYERALRGRAGNPLRFRIEHVQTRRPGHLERMKALGLLPSLQPAHLLSDGPWAREILGEERWKLSYGLADFVRAGLRPAGGSDFPVEPPEPVRGIFAAVTGGGGRRPDQALSREGALDLFTSWAAEAAFEEKLCGRLERGFFCDLTLLDKDLLACPLEEIEQAKPLAVVVGGNVAWRAG